MNAKTFIVPLAVYLAAGLLAYLYVNLVAGDRLRAAVVGVVIANALVWATVLINSRRLKQGRPLLFSGVRIQRGRNGKRWDVDLRL